MNTLQGEKYLWRLPEKNKQEVLTFASLYNLSFPIVQTLVSRGFCSKESLDEFLFSSFEKDVAHPSLLHDAQKSVDRILQAIKNKEKILIFGDYDVDGITSSALMVTCLLHLGADVNFFLPHRVRDGYGISKKIVERAAKNNYKLIITVDNGITAFEAADKAKECGIDLIITDHHRQHEKLPDAFAIVNPNVKGCKYPYKKFAGVGVAFKLLSLLFEQKKIPLPEKAYELLLLGTIADVVPLTGENRFWVRYCLNYMNKADSYALNVLKKNGKLTKPAISSTDIGFCIAPQINALGRLEDPRQGVKFLLGLDKKEVDEVGRILFELNQTRRKVERSIFEQIQEEIDQKRIDIDKENIIIAASHSWAPGVIGLVASRLVSAYGKPTLLFHLNKKGIAKGSCRSIPEFNMFDALQSSSHLLKSFGGHSFAAGLSLKADDIPELKKHLEALIVEKLTEFDLKQKIELDADVSLGDLNQKFMNDIAFLEPFGNENRQPMFYLKNVVQVQKPTLLKDLHVKCSVFSDGVIKPLIFFNRPELFEKLLEHGEKPLHLAAQISENHWGGRVSVELIGTDVSFD
ncbi:single-stranded-DNA-specific exonuclease RecJ [bacterium]|nr:single-stranded-DNA-specific exonuclease RecJ [bacterium]